MGDVEYIGYRSWNRIRNTGDAITPYVLEQVSNLPSRQVGPDVPHILGVGSILFFGNKNSHIWGSGILNPTMELPDIGKSSFHAVRGKKTYSFLQSLGVALPDLPLGDPGIFAREIIGGALQEGQGHKYRAAFVPHHSSVNHPLYDEVRKNPDFVVIDTLDDTLLPLELIMQSKVVISQSLHGIIYAESLGKPNLWISERQDPIWRFKFEDWYSTTLYPQMKAESLETPVEELIVRASHRCSNIDKDSLALALPQNAGLSKSAPFMDFKLCRGANPAVFFVEKDLLGEDYMHRDVSPEIILELQKKIFPLFYSFFKRWAERTYCLIVPAGQIVGLNPEKISKALRFLDENAVIDFAFLTSAAGVDRDVIEKDGVKLINSADGRRLAGEAILLRPDSYQLSMNFVTFCM